jgi:hypothetical protein
MANLYLSSAIFHIALVIPAAYRSTQSGIVSFQLPLNSDLIKRNSFFLGEWFAGYFKRHRSSAPPCILCLLVLSSQSQHFLFENDLTSVGCQLKSHAHLYQATNKQESEPQKMSVIAASVAFVSCPLLTAVITHRFHLVSCRSPSLRPSVLIIVITFPRTTIMPNSNSFSGFFY